MEDWGLLRVTLEADARRLADMHAVYRMFDGSARLLYVGRTGRAGERFGDHSVKRWFPLVANITLEWFPTKAAADVAERRAIKRERPRYNIAGIRPAAGRTVPAPVRNGVVVTRGRTRRQQRTDRYAAAVAQIDSGEPQMEAAWKWFRSEIRHYINGSPKALKETLIFVTDVLVCAARSVAEAGPALGDEDVRSHPGPRVMASRGEERL